MVAVLELAWARECASRLVDSLPWELGSWDSPRWLLRTVSQLASAWAALWAYESAMV